MFVDAVPAQHQGLQRVLQNFLPDVVIGDDMLFGVLPMLLGPDAKRPPCTCEFEFRQAQAASLPNKTPVVPAAFETDVGKRGSSHPRPSATRRRK